ncbi:nucleotide sugar dehydrogenase [Candidatus Saganbacteria bacterium]|nr:nucleotide sugar dehydrogenase [Candidatus Saganbacteria bacterium]
MFKHQVCVVGGCGHVGLPLAITFADRGLKTVIYDINEKAIARVARGEMPFLERGAAPRLKKTLNNKKLLVSDNPRVISDSEHVVIIIGTPIDEFLNPRIQDIHRTLKELQKYLKPGQTIILRSTIYPGTTRLVKNLVKNKNIKVAFAPERVAQGYAMEELKSLPQIVSGVDQASATSAEKLFKKIAKDVIVLSPEEAELAKLMTNAWRYIQFAVANQFFTIAEGRGLDFYKIFHAVKHKYPRTADFPSPGFAAGPCLFKDTMQIAAFAENSFFLGHAAMLINEGLPNFIIKQLKENYDLSQKTVGILGMAFKGDSDDRRDSLSYKLKKALEVEAQAVLCTDVYIREAGFDALKTVLKKSDILILGAPHKEYRNLKFRQGSRVVDIWNFYGQGANL